MERSGLEEITAVVLAGGLGTRLRSRVADRPKVLAEVSGRPFLAYLLDHLERAGQRRCVLCTGYQADLVEAAFGSRHGKMELLYSREEEPLGTGGAVRLAAPLLTGDPVLVLNGDSFFKSDLPRFLAWHRSLPSPTASLLMAEMEDTSRFGRVSVDQEGQILRFEEKRPDAGPGWINTGIYLISRAALEAIPAGRPVSLERETFPAWIGHGFYGLQAPGDFLDIGTPESFDAAEAFLARELG